MLKRLAEAIKKLNNKSIITAGINTDHTTTSNKYENLALNMELYKKGSKLSIKDGYVLIGKGISAVFVSASLSYYSIATSNYRHRIIYTTYEWKY